MAGTMRMAVALNGYGLSHRGPEGVEREVLPWHEMLLIAETAEETGYESIFTPEIAAREAFSTLTGFAAATREILLATGVVPLRARTAPTLAMAAATVQGEPVGPIHLPDPDADPAPLYLAALGPRMTELAGEVADGVVLNWCTPERVAEARARVRRGAERVGGAPPGGTVAVYVRACLGHDEEHALAALKEVAGQYGAMDRYRRQLEAMGLGEEATLAGAAWEAGRPAEVPGS